MQVFLAAHHHVIWGPTALAQLGHGRLFTALQQLRRQPLAGAKFCLHLAQQADQRERFGALGVAEVAIAR